MRSFKQFLNENLTIAHDFELFRKMVQKDCSEYLQNTSPSKLLFRGLSEDQGLFIYSRIRLNRKPLNTPQKVHEELDELFEKQFRFKYRSGSAFGYTSSTSANGYAGDGGLYLIFPENGYTLCGSHKVKDLYTLCGSLKVNDHWIKIEDIKNVQGLMFNNYTYLDQKDTKKYQEISYRLMDGFKLSPEDNEIRKKINAELFDNLEYFESKNPDDYGKNEIMIRGKGYYGLQIIDIDDGKKLVNQLYET